MGRVESHQGPPGLRRPAADRLDLKRHKGGSILARKDWADLVFAFHDGEELGHRMLARLAKRSGLTPEDLT